ncbi:serine protease snake-like [Nasonia vitripennis]|uniref:Peptidase S1 domain-containing protein n=1 Tax=Nasonia vitripennis TaxID=7425 RepID=A0A7M7LSE7_NASVI|nr:serine protease snake-like [Nasonia vitripennis]
MSIEFQKALVYLFIISFHVSSSNIFGSATSVEKTMNTIGSAQRKIVRFPIQSNDDSSVPNIKRIRKATDRISDIKCKEYSEMTREVVWIKKIELMPMRLRCKKPIQLFVVGGSVAEPKEYPHMVALGRTVDTSTTEYFCGGSLISDQWILTAAHCTTDARGLPNVALIGSANLNKINELNTGKLMSIESIKPHPDYNSSQLYADIALIKLSKPVEFSKTVKPACLYPIPDLEPKYLWASGYGSTSSFRLREGMTGLNLTKARLQLTDMKHCKQVYRGVKQLPHGIDSESQLCADDKKGGWKRDTCAGDSGVPLQWTHPSGCLQEIVAVTSFGISCAVPKMPAVYTKVSHYIDWIESVVWPNEN